MPQVLNIQKDKLFIQLDGSTYHDSASVNIVDAEGKVVHQLLSIHSSSVSIKMPDGDIAKKVGIFPSFFSVYVDDKKMMVEPAPIPVPETYPIDGLMEPVREAA